MLTATFPISEALTAPLESDPNRELELREAGYPNTEVRWHRSSNTCIVSIDRDHLGEMIAAVDNDHSDCVDHSDCHDESDLEDAADDAVRELRRVVRRRLRGATIVDEFGNPITVDQVVL